MSARITPPAPLLHFKRGDRVVYREPYDGMLDIGVPVVVKRVVNVRTLSGQARYYALEGMPGIILPADRLRWA